MRETESTGESRAPTATLGIAMRKAGNPIKQSYQNHRRDEKEQAKFVEA
jgi:hypothetical protein